MSGIPLHERSSLNLGSGRAYDPSAVNLDITSATSPDVIHDLDVVPWPFPDDRFTRVAAIDVIEHLERPLDALDEIHRICQHGSVVEIALPHFSAANAYSDLTHRHAFGYFSFDPVTGASHHDFYSSRRYAMRAREIAFYHRPLNRIVRPLANRHPEAYERHYAWLFPAWFLRFELEVIKTASS